MASFALPKAPLRQNAAELRCDVTILPCFRNGGLGKPEQTDYLVR
jgi:hypothetical protein